MFGFMQPGCVFFFEGYHQHSVLFVVVGPDVWKKTSPNKNLSTFHGGYIFQPLNNPLNNPAALEGGNVAAPGWPRWPKIPTPCWVWNPAARSKRSGLPTVSVHAPSIRISMMRRMPRCWGGGLVGCCILQGLDGGFLKWWYPTTMDFPTKNDHFGVFWGYHHLRKHPDDYYYFLLD